MPERTRGPGRRRTRRHLGLAAASVLSLAAVYRMLPDQDPIHDLSLASAYVALVLLGASLAIGPWNVLRGRPNPVSTHLRRDVGIWAGILGLGHLGIGLFVHLRGRPWEYFVYPPDQPHAFPIRYDLFGFANHTGLIAGLVLLALLLCSNDASLVRLGTRRWKAVQRLGYLAAVLVVAHAVAFQVIENRQHQPAFLVAFALVVCGVAELQRRGYLEVRAGRRQRARPTTARPATSSAPPARPAAGTGRSRQR